MSKLTTIIQQKNFELIRDRIGEILADELLNQQTLGSDVIQPTVWVERFIPFDKEELPAINIMLSKGNFEGQNQFTSVGSYTYIIDIYNKSKTTHVGLNKVRGDVKSIKELQRLIGVIFSILESPFYNTLGFDKPLIRHTEVSDFSIADPTDEDEAINMTFGRINFVAECNESSEGYTPIIAAGYDTQVKLHETDLGYKYEFNNQ